MSGSVALRSWRRRAQRRAEGPWVPKPSIVAVGVVAVLGAVLGGRALNGESAAPPTPATAGPPPCPAVATALHADVDGDGCDDEVAYADGVLTAGAVRMAVGRPGDEVAVGRWACGAATAALLRPATGEVFRFDGWATADRSVPAVLVGRVDDAVSIAPANRPGTACDDVVVTRQSGPPVLLPERPVAG